MNEFFLPYDAVRQSPSPEDALMDFCRVLTKQERIWRSGTGKLWNGNHLTLRLCACVCVRHVRARDTTPSPT